MTMTLCLWASAGPARLCLIEDDAILAFADAGQAVPPDPIRGATLEQMTRAAMQDAGRQITDIDRIAVDIGPGRLTAVRAAASFANGLAFGLAKPMLPVISAAVAGMAATTTHELPAIVVHKAAAGTAYVSRYRTRLETVRHGPLAETFARVITDLPAFALVGLDATEASALAPKARIVDAGDGAVTAEAFARFVAVDAAAFRLGPVTPMTEQSDLIDG